MKTWGLANNKGTPILVPPSSLEKFKYDLVTTFEANTFKEAFIKKCQYLGVIKHDELVDQVLDHITTEVDFVLEDGVVVDFSFKVVQDKEALEKLKGLQIR